MLADRVRTIMYNMAYLLDMLSCLLTCAERQCMSFLLGTNVYWRKALGAAGKWTHRCVVHIVRVVYLLATRYFLWVTVPVLHYIIMVYTDQEDHVTSTNAYWPMKSPQNYLNTRKFSILWSKSSRDLVCQEKAISMLYTGIWLNLAWQLSLWPISDILVTLYRLSIMPPTQHRTTIHCTATCKVLISQMFCEYGTLLISCNVRGKLSE